MSEMHVINAMIKQRDEARSWARKYYQKYRMCAKTRKELRELKDDAIIWAQRVTKERDALKEEYLASVKRECDTEFVLLLKQEDERDELQSKLDEVIVFLKWMMAQDEIFDVDKYITDMLKRLEG